MSADTYELLALAARYWFILLAALIVFRAWRATVRDNRSAKVLRDWSGGAGCVGELVVRADDRKQKRKSLKGARYPVPAEALLGSGRMTDIRIEHPDMRRKHVWLHYQPGQMVLTPVKRAQVESPVSPDGKKVLRDGDEMTIGSLRMMMVFYDVKDAVGAPPAVTATEAKGKDSGDPIEENFWE